MDDLWQEEEYAFTCPYCGAEISMLLDTSVRQQRYVEDCEVCCRPFEVAAECEPGEILSLAVLDG